MTDYIRKVTDALVDETREQLNDAAEETIQKGRKAWKDVRDRSQDLLDDAQRRGSEAWDDARHLVRKYPTRAIGFALLAGVLFGGMIFRRGSD
jgi:ElaB/YqjD/DUF883 family membrane-anchored ribosome-binding protein